MQNSGIPEGRGGRKRRISPLLGVFAIFIIAAGALWFVTQMAEKRGSEVLLRRYCDDPARHVALVRDILTKSEPAGEKTRRPYIIAAKLLYIVQRKANEPVPAYLERLRQNVVSACR